MLWSCGEIYAVTRQCCVYRTIFLLCCGIIVENIIIPSYNDTRSGVVIYPAIDQCTIICWEVDPCYKVLAYTAILYAVIISVLDHDTGIKILNLQVLYSNIGIFTDNSGIRAVPCYRITRTVDSDIVNTYDQAVHDTSGAFQASIEYAAFVNYHSATEIVMLTSTYPAHTITIEDAPYSSFVIIIISGIAYVIITECCKRIITITDICSFIIANSIII